MLYDGKRYIETTDIDCIEEELWILTNVSMPEQTKLTPENRLTTNIGAYKRYRPVRNNDKYIYAQEAFNKGNTNLEKYYSTNEFKKECPMIKWFKKNTKTSNKNEKEVTKKVEVDYFHEAKGSKHFFMTLEQFKESPEERMKKMEIRDIYKSMGTSMWDNPAEKYRAMSKRFDALSAKQEAEFEKKHSTPAKQIYLKGILPQIEAKGLPINIEMIQLTLDIDCGYEAFFSSEDIVRHLTSLGFKVEFDRLQPIPTILTIS